MHQKSRRAKKVVYETLWLSRVHSPAGGGSGAGVEPKDFPFLDARDILSNTLLLKTAAATWFVFCTNPPLPTNVSHTIITPAGQNIQIFQQPSSRAARPAPEAVSIHPAHTNEGATNLTKTVGIHRNCSNFRRVLAEYAISV